jgi:hypothetical protein
MIGHCKCHFVFKHTKIHEEELNFSKTFFSRRPVLLKYHIWSIVLYGAGKWTVPKVDQMYLETFEMWCWRRMEKIILTDRVKSEVLQGIKEERNILRTSTVTHREANSIRCIFRGNCHIKTCY